MEVQWRVPAPTSEEGEQDEMGAAFRPNPFATPLEQAWERIKHDELRPLPGLAAAQARSFLEAFELVADSQIRWFYRGEVWATDERDLTEEDVHALLDERRNQKRLKIQKARDLKEMARRLESTPMRRERLPADVQRAVWRRDQGRCVNCGRQSDLEFDHIVPHSLGGSDTERNLQLLCAECNRRKGATLAGEQAEGRRGVFDHPASGAGAGQATSQDRPELSALIEYVVSQSRGGRRDGGPAQGHGGVATDAEDRIAAGHGAEEAAELAAADALLDAVDDKLLAADEKVAALETELEKLRRLARMVREDVTDSTEADILVSWHEYWQRDSAVTSAYAELRRAYSVVEQYRVDGVVLRPPVRRDC